MVTMNSLRARQRQRFRRELLVGSVRYRLLGGLGLLVLAMWYGSWAAAHLARHGAERDAFDRPVVNFASRIVTAPDVEVRFVPKTEDEVYLLAVVRAQQDTVFGVTLLLFRWILTSVVAGMGMVLLTAGATEWEVRSALASAQTPGAMTAEP